MRAIKVRPFTFLWGELLDQDTKTLELEDQLREMTRYKEEEIDKVYKMKSDELSKLLGEEIETSTKEEEMKP